MVPFKPVVRKVLPIHCFVTFIAGLILISWMPKAPLMWLRQQPVVALEYVVLMRQDILQ